MGFFLKAQIRYFNFDFELFRSFIVLGYVLSKCMIVVINGMKESIHEWLIAVTVQRLLKQFVEQILKESDDRDLLFGLKMI